MTCRASSLGLGPSTEYTPPATKQTVMRKRTVTLLLTMLGGVTGGAAPAGAEWNLDLYGGAAWIQSSDLKVRGEDDTHAVNLTIFDINTDAGFTVGTRFGYWLEPVPFLGFDLTCSTCRSRSPARPEPGLRP